MSNVIQLGAERVKTVAEMLRTIADELEAGEYGEVRNGALVLDCETVEMFGLGGADKYVAHYLLTLGASKLLEG